MSRSWLFVGVLLTAPMASGSDLEAAKEQVRQELAAARKAHPAFDQHAEAAYAQVQAFPQLTIEQAFCVVIRGQVDDPACEKPLADALSFALRPLVPLGKAPLMEEGKRGDIAPRQTPEGLPLFEQPPPSRPPYVRDAYGLGVNSDATGRPFVFRTRDGTAAGGRVQLDAYGPGVHMDEFGRPVTAVPYP